MSRSRLSNLRFLSIIVAVLVLMPPLLGAKGGCRKRPANDGLSDDASGQGIDVDRKLQVSRVIPDAVAPSVDFSIEVLGAGFLDGATVRIGAVSARQVERRSETRLAVSMSALFAGDYDVTVTNPDGEVVTLRRGLSVRSALDDVGKCALSTIYFDFDQDSLTTQVRTAIDALVPCLQEVRGRIVLEGHADERGTTEYNLALGQRRADSVQRYLQTQGIAASKMRTVTYGEERPVDRGSNERAWALNRRVEIKVER
jgi:peptidoglycan-associated lipoprotein